MSVAVFFFFTGLLLGACGGVRILFRYAQHILRIILRLAKARGQPPPKLDPLSNLIVLIRLKDTFVLEVLGFGAGMVMVIVALAFI